MTSAFTTNKYIEKPANGDYPDTWNIPVNNDWDVIDKALGSAVTKSLSNVDITLTISEAQNQQIVLTGALTANVNIIIPFQAGSSTAAVGGSWIVTNGTSGSASVSIITQVTGSTGITIPQGYRSTVYSDQTNVHFADDVRLAINTTGLTVTAATSTQPASVGLTIPVTVPNGGTGAITHTTGNVLLGNGTSPFSEVAPGTSGNVLTSNGTTWTSAAPSGGGGGGLTSLTISGGTTGLQVNGATSATLTANGTWTLSGTLGVPYGGTGATSLTGYLKGNGTGAFTAVTTIPGSDISGTVANATSATSATTATTATTATNQSGGTVNATTVTASGAISSTGGDVTVPSANKVVVGSGAAGASMTYSSGSAYFGSSSGQFLVSSASYTGGAISGSTLNWYCTGTTFTLASSITSAQCYFGTAWTNVSDQRTKKNINDYTLGLSSILQLRPRTFEYNGVNDTPDDGKVRVGFIAQEVQTTDMVSMVMDDPEHPGFYSINTNDLIFTLVNAVKELSAKVAALEAKVP